MNKEEYSVEIVILNKEDCRKIDPFAQCSVDDCMECYNSFIKITRNEDKVVLRDDLANKIEPVNNKYYRKRIKECKDIELFKRDPVNAIEEKFNIKLHLYQKIILSIIFKEKKNK